MNLDLEGFAISSGAACSAGSSDPSHVLTAMGIPSDLAMGSIRISLGRYTVKEEINKMANELVKVVNHLRSLSSFGK